MSGPVFFEETVYQERYMKMLRDKSVIELASLNNFSEIMWMQDGEPSHYGRIVREYFENTFDTSKIT